MKRWGGGVPQKKRETGIKELENNSVRLTHMSKAPSRRAPVVRERKCMHTAVWTSSLTKEEHGAGQGYKDTDVSRRLHGKTANLG